MADHPIENLVLLHDHVQPGVVQIDLTSTGSFSAWIFVGKLYSMSAEVQVPSGTTWASAVVGMEWSVANDKLAVANTFSPVVSFSTSTRGVVNIDIASMVYVRFRVTTAEGASGPAQVVYQTE